MIVNLTRIELAVVDVLKSVNFYEAVLGVKFEFCNYTSPYYRTNFSRQILIIRQHQGAFSLKSSCKIQFELKGNDLESYRKILLREKNITPKFENMGGFEIYGKRLWDRWALIVQDPDGNEIFFRRSLFSWPETVWQRFAEIPSVLKIIIKRSFDRLLDGIEYHLNICTLREKEVSEFTHLVSSREGVYAVNERGYRKLLRGQYFGLSIQNGDIYCFQANGPLWSPKKRGRIIKITTERDLKGCRLLSARVVYKGLDNGCHQIDFIGEKLYVVDTYNHRILRLDDSFCIDAEYYPVGKGEERSAVGGAHMNSLTYYDNSFWLVFHNNARLKNSELMRLDNDFVTQEVITLDAREAHNVVFLEDGGFIVCDSGGGRLVNQSGPIASLGGMMLRGLSIDNERVVVGDSYFSTRLGRRYVPGNVYFYDRDLRHLSTVVLPAAPTEIRKIDGVDLSLSNANYKLARIGPAVSSALN